jgi:DNA-binding beta-propeller fold protein YncE
VRGHAPSFRMGRRLPITATNARNRRPWARVAGIAVAALPVLGALAVTSPLAQVHASAATITAPTYVRTIGSNGQSTMYPSGVAVDAAGNVYVADTGNYQIEKYQAGTTNLLWSVGVRGAPIGGGTDSFVAPRDLATDGTHVFVADTDNADVQELNASDGSFVQEIHTFGPGNADSFEDPIGISVGHNASNVEEILVSDGVSGNEYVFDTSFNLLMTIPPTNANEGTRDAATDSAGDIYTADYRGNAIDKYSPTGTFITSWGASSGCTDVAKPYGVDIDTADTPNRVYVASSDLEQIKVFDTDGNCLNVGTTGSNAIGTPSSTSNNPTGLFQLRRVAVGAGTNPLIYAADLWGLKILTYNSSDGTIASSAQPLLGSGTYPAAGGLNEDHGIAIDPTTSQIFVANTVNQRIERFDLPNGDNAFDWGTKGVQESSASFNWAQGIGYDAEDGNVWVANTRNNRIDEFSTDGTPIASCPNTSRLTSSFNWPMAVAFDSAGTMYVADTFNNRIEAISVSQCSNSTTVTPIWSVGTRGSGSGQFIKPWDIVYDPTQNRLLVTDTDNSRIVALNPSTGAVESLFPSITKGTGPGQVEQPEGIAVDASGNIWVADTGNNRVEEFTSAGVFDNQMVGTYGCCYSAPNTDLNAPQGLAFDSNGLLYVADANNNRIQVFQPTGGSPFGAPGPYTAVAPFRICDTRPAAPGIAPNQCNTGPGIHGPLTSGETRAITVGVAGSGVPTSGVSAVVVNVTAIAPTKLTYLTLFPANGATPATSNLNPAAGQVIANLVEVAVSSTGQLDVYNDAGTTNITIDIEGWVSTTTSGTAGLYNPTAPTRICDTRTGRGIAPNQCDMGGAHPILAGHPLTFDVHGSGSPVPATGVSAVVFNLTAIAPTAPTVLKAYPSNVGTPTASNINLPAGAVVPNRVIVPVPAGCAAPHCTVTIANSAGSVNVVVDIDGWFTDSTGSQTGALFSGVTPSRLCDTRVGNSNDPGCSESAIPAGGVLNIQVAGKAGIPSMSSSSPPVALVVNVTAVQATTGTYVTVYSSDLGTQPEASDLSVSVGQADTNLVLVQVGSDGTINLYNAAGSVELVVDVLGYYS